MKLFRKNITFYGPWIMTRRGVNRITNKDFNFGGCYAHFIDEYSLLYDESEWQSIVQSMTLNCSIIVF